MNFQLTKEQEFVRKMVREFATNEVEPLQPTSTPSTDSLLRM